MSYLGVDDDFPSGTASDPFLIPGYTPSGGDFSGSGTMNDPWVWRGDTGSGQSWDWSSGFKNIASGVANVIRAFQPGQSVPPGYRYNSVTGRLEPVSSGLFPGIYPGAPSSFPSWLLPVGLGAVGLVLLMRKR